MLAGSSCFGSQIAEHGGFDAAFERIGIGFFAAACGVDHAFDDCEDIERGESEIWDARRVAPGKKPLHESGDRIANVLLAVSERQAIRGQQLSGLARDERRGQRVLVRASRTRTRATTAARHSLPRKVQSKSVGSSGRSRCWNMRSTSLGRERPRDMGGSASRAKNATSLVSLLGVATPPVISQMKYIL